MGPDSHFLLTLWAELCEGGVQSPGAVCTFGLFMSYYGAVFAEFSTVIEV